MPTVSGPGRRYAGPHRAPTLPPSARIEEELGLEENYGVGRIWLTPRDPHTLHVAWELNREQLDAARGRLALRIGSGADRTQHVQQIDLTDDARSAFVHVDAPGNVYEAEIGFFDATECWRSYARSSPASTPPQRSSESEEVRFVTVMIERVEHPVFAEAGGEPAPLAYPVVAEEAGQPPRPEEFEPREPVVVPEQARPHIEAVLGVPPAPQISRPETWTVELPAAEALIPSTTPAVVSPPTSPSPAPSASPGPSAETPPVGAVGPPPPRAPAFAPSLPSPLAARGEGVAHAFASRVRAPWRIRLVEMPAPGWSRDHEAAMTELIEAVAAAQVTPSSVELALRPEAIPAPDQWRGGAPPTGPAGGAPGLEWPSSKAAAPIPSAPRKGFWFNINAELIVYGATEPDASVTIGGERISLRPDGSFTLRFALPDGEYELTAHAASARGDDTRSAQLDFRRRTAYWGDVGAHPTDAALAAPPVAEVET